MSFRFGNLFLSKCPPKELAEEAGELVEKSALEEPTNKEVIRPLYLILTIEVKLFDG